MEQFKFKESQAKVNLRGSHVSHVCSLVHPMKSRIFGCLASIFLFRLKKKKKKLKRKKLKGKRLSNLKLRIINKKLIKLYIKFTCLL
jgi:hypothetical protein